MARPPKAGLDYFPLDVDFLQDRRIRLLIAEFGSRGLHVLLKHWTDIYKDKGYYKIWDKDGCLLVSAELSGAAGVCSPEQVREITQGCVRCSLFDKRVASVFGVLTSAGIQRRYLRASAGRTKIRLIQEFFLLDLYDERDVLPIVQRKLSFHSIKEEQRFAKGETPVLRPEIGVSSLETPISRLETPQRKVKESTYYDSDSYSAAAQVAEPTRTAYLPPAAPLSAIQLASLDALIGIVQHPEAARQALRDVLQVEPSADGRYHSVTLATYDRAIQIILDAGRLKGGDTTT